MKDILASILTAAILAATASGVSGTEYFVAKGGGAPGDGRSEKTAFGTIAKGVAALRPGDVLTILPGHYFEAVSARISGKPGAPILIRAKRPGTVLLRGDVDAPRFRPADPWRYTYCAELASRVEGVAERSTRRMYEPMLSAAEVGLTPGSFYQDAEAGRLYVHASDSAHPDWHALSISVTNGFGILLTPPGGSQTVHDVVIDGLSLTGYQAREFPPEPGSRCRWGLHVVMGERVVVRRCTAFLNSGGIYLLAPTDCVLEDCWAFGNRSRFLDLGNNILGWSVSDTTFRRNTVEGSSSGAGPSNGDITFYGGARYDKRPTRGRMESNLAIRAGLMVKGAYGDDSVQKGNIVVGRGAYFYRPPDETNLLMPQYETPRAKQIYADPINHDFRPQSDTSPGGPVFYVSPTGRDTAPGTSPAKAWRTLAHASQNVRPGHTVYVTAGAYREPLVPASSGTAEQPIRFLRYGRDRVVLDGQERLAVGVDLSGRAHVEVRGLVIRRFTRYGLAAQGGENLSVRQSLVIGCGADGARLAGVAGLVFDHNLLLGNQGAGLHMENCPQASVTGNVFDAGGGPRLVCDTATAQGLWSDGNAFVPGGKGPLVCAGARSFPSLAAWQQATGMDPTSLAAEPGYRDSDPERCDFALRPDSPLVGRGPQASTIGPFLSLAVKRPAVVDDVRVHQVTDTTASIEWWTPHSALAATLQYGLAPDCPHRLETPISSFHTASLIGLKPATKYHFRVGAAALEEELLLAPYQSSVQPASSASTATRPGSFQTAAGPLPPRVFHVAVDGDDSRSGLSAAEAWRSVAHAAAQVRAGDTVLIHAGKYEEYVLVRATGDRQAPITLRAAPGETVWMEGSDRFRTTAFRLPLKHHVHVAGIRFRHFRYAPHSGDPINIDGGSSHAVRRCFYDGREPHGYVGNFLRASNCSRLLVENCVMINGMGEGLVLGKCPEVTVRHCVFYNNFIRAISVWNFEPGELVTLSHNLFCDTIPEKTGNAFIRLNHLENLRSDHNGYFARRGPAERRIVETAKIGGKAVGVQMPGTYRGVDLLLADAQRQAGQERGSVFGNPGIRVVSELLPHRAPEAQWRKVEMHWDGKNFRPWDFTDFLPSPTSPLSRAADGQPIGLDPEAFR